MDIQNKLYELTISVTRHGPKEGFSGALSSEGKESVLRYYQQAWHNISAKSDVPRKLVSSPINRAVQTANIYKLVLEENGNLTTDLEIETDERLSEKDLASFVDPLEPHQTEWFEAWYISDFGKKAVEDFSDWILEQIENQKQSGGFLEIDGFSHGPVMAAFVLRLEEVLGQDILIPVESGQSRFSIARLFSNPDSQFGYLSLMTLGASSKNPDFISLKFSDKITDIPVEILKSI